MSTMQKFMPNGLHSLANVDICETWPHSATCSPTHRDTYYPEWDYVKALQ